MVGRIEELATPEKPGRITTHSGMSRYDFSYRHPEGLPTELVRGQLVSFELERSSPEFAVGVRPREAHAPQNGSRDLRREIRYQGFEQTHSVRSFRFQAWRSGEENEEAIVTVDLALFRRHGIGLQEGPGICLRFVEAEFAESGVTGKVIWTRALSDEDILVHRAEQKTSKSSRKKRA